MNKGLISVDRGTKATLTRTIPRSKVKSSTKDSSFSIFELKIQHRLTKDFILSQSKRYNFMVLEISEKIPIITHSNIEKAKKNISTLFSRDSGLEAFSRNPAHGSFSALTFQSTEFANYVNQRFLSY